MRVPWPAASTIAAIATTLGGTPSLQTGPDGMRGPTNGSTRRPLSGERDALDLDQGSLGQLAHGHRGARRIGLHHVARVELVHRGEVRHVAEEDRRLHDPVEPGAGGVEDRGEVLQSAFCLIRDAAAYNIPRCR